MIRHLNDDMFTVHSAWCSVSDLLQIETRSLVTALSLISDILSHALLIPYQRRNIRKQIRKWNFVFEETKGKAIYLTCPEVCSFLCKKTDTFLRSDEPVSLCYQRSLSACSEITLSWSWNNTSSHCYFKICLQISYLISGKSDVAGTSRCCFAVQSSSRQLASKCC